MERNLLTDTIRMLTEHIDSEAYIDIAIHDDPFILEFIDVIHKYDLPFARKQTVLACCLLIHQAMSRHTSLTASDNATLTRGILDGDYFIGLVYRIAARRKEWKLLACLTPFHKRAQLQVIQGKAVRHLFADLKKEIVTYLDKQCA